MESYRQNRVFQGVLVFLFGMALLSAMDACAKLLVEDGITAVQIIAVRSVIIVPIMLVGFKLSGQFSQLKPSRPVAQAVRGLFGSMAPLAFFASLSYMPLSNAVVIFFSSAFLTAIGAHLFLGEHIGIRRWTAIVIGYVGVYIAMAPENSGEWYGYILVLVGSSTYAYLFVSGKLLAHTESITSLVLTYNLFGGLVCLALMPWLWQSMDTSGLLVMIVLALLAVAGHFCFTWAFAHVEASLLVPFEYTGLIWAILFDLIIWQKLPVNRVWLGAAIIIASGLFLAWREHQAHKRKLTTG